MSRARLTLCVLAIGATLAWLAALALYFVPNRTGVCKASFDRVELGMTREDVEAIFGRPPDEFVRIPVGNGKPPLEILEPGVMGWSSHNGMAIVRFNEAGRVDLFTWADPPGSMQEFFRPLLDWLP